MMSTPSVTRSMRPGRLALPIACTLLLLAPWETEAQVRRDHSGAQRPAAARPATTPSQPRAPAARSNVQGNTRVGAGSNVAIGNDINIVRPPAGGYPGGRPPAAGYPPGYRPPVVVPVYPGYSYDSGPSTGELLAVGVVAGATAGLVSGVMQQPSSTTVVNTAPATPSGTPLTIGTQLAALPSGCTVQTVGSVTYHRCGTAWVQGYMQGSQVMYVVVPEPG